MSIHHVRVPVKASGHTTTIVAPNAAANDRKCMALVPGTGIGLTDELQGLLRARLRIVGLILFLGSAAFYIRSLVAPVEAAETASRITGSIHALEIGVLAICVGVLFSRIPLGTPCLRRIELTIFGSVVAFFAYLQSSEFTYQSLLTGVDENQHMRIFNLGAISVAMRWFAIIVLYGAFIPNTWKRCLVVVSIIAATPLLLLGTLCRSCPIMSPLWPTAVFDMLVLLSIASATAIFGSHRISALQQEAFEAKKLGQYHLKRLIASGGMGDVYLAEHMLLRRKCAVKTIRADHTADSLTLARFEREVQAMATLTHWNSVDIYDYGHSPDGTFFYVMEYLPGLTLQEMVDRHGPLPPGRAIHFLRQVCAALREAHSIGLIHRDIKPSNVLVCRRGTVNDVAKLLDFGLVQDIHGKTSPEIDRLTLNGAVLGSPPFISPEQARGNQTVDDRTDIYGLGGLAYFLVTGRTPFERESALEMMAAHLHEKPTPPGEVRPGVPADLEAIILRCLAKKPVDRFADVSEVERALAECDAAQEWNEDHAEAWWRESSPREPVLA